MSCHLNWFSVGTGPKAEGAFVCAKLAPVEKIKRMIPQNRFFFIICNLLNINILKLIGCNGEYVWYSLSHGIC
jgi:hypothetical protein